MRLPALAVIHENFDHPATILGCLSIITHSSTLGAVRLSMRSSTSAGWRWQ
jgi:hypothetical protein